MGKIGTNPKYVIYITGTDLHSLGGIGGVGGRVNSEKLEKMSYF